MKHPLTWDDICSFFSLFHSITSSEEVRVTCGAPRGNIAAGVSLFHRSWWTFIIASKSAFLLSFRMPRAEDSTGETTGKTSGNCVTSSLSDEYIAPSRGVCLINQSACHLYFHGLSIPRHNFDWRPLRNGRHLVQERNGRDPTGSS